MKRALQIVSTLAFIAFFASCTTVNYVRVQLAQPSKEELPKDIQSILLVNRTVDDNYRDYLEDSLQVKFYKQLFNVDTMLFDSTAADTTIRALGELLFESGRYDVVIPQNRFLPFTKNTFFSDEMDWNEVNQLCSDFNTDVLMSMDHLNMHVKTSYSRETMYDRTSDRYFKGYFARMTIQYSTLFRVYDPLKKSIVNRNFMTDTLVWEQFGMSNRELFGKMTSVKDALIETGISIALDASEKIAPRWKPDTRMYYLSSNQYFVKAHEAVQKNNWDEALNYWKEVAEGSSSKSLKSKAQFNVAIAYEISGDIDEAYNWALKSYETRYKNLTYSYLDKLKSRKEQLDKMK